MIFEHKGWFQKSGNPDGKKNYKQGKKINKEVYKHQKKKLCRKN